MKLLIKSILATIVFVILIQMRAYSSVESASGWEEKPVFISGEIVNYSSGGDKTVLLTFRDLLGLNEIKVIQIDENNSFQFSFTLAYPQDFYISYGNGNLETLFCSPGDSLFVKINAEYGGRTSSDGSHLITFIEGTSKQTNLLISDFLKKIPNENYIYLNYNTAIESKTPLEYLDYIRERERLYREFYDKFVFENQTTEIFRKWALDQLKYGSYHDLLYYAWYRKDVLKSSFEIPEEYFSFLETYDMDDSEVISMKHADFLDEYSKYFTRKIRKDYGEKLKIAYEESGITGVFAVRGELIEKYTTGFTRDFLYANTFCSLLGGKDLEGFNQLYDVEKINNNHFLKSLSEEHDKLINFLSNTNTESANISALNSQSDILSELISKYSGKWIYIDFWATWCTPCLAEFDASKKLQQEWKDRDIVFVYLANRCPENVWKSTIADRKLSGEHILLTNDQYNILSTKFNIIGIPHYVLINKAGNIVSSNAPRPSDGEQLMRLFE